MFFEDREIVKST